jgi:hypothetical protein
MLQIIELHKKLSPKVTADANFLFAFAGLKLQR